MFFDCVVIGAGILGITITRELANKFPNWNILILEQSLAGMGASRFSAGLHIPYGYNPKVKRLSEISAHEYIDLMQNSANYPLYPILFTGIASTNKYEEISDKFYTSFNNFQKKIDLIPKSIGHINLDASQILFPIRDAHYANVLGVIHHYIEEMNAKEKIRIWEGVTMSKLSDEENIIKISLRDGRRIQSKKVILAPGPWIQEKSFQSILCNFHIRTKKIVSLHIDKRPEANDPGLFLFDHDAFLLPLHNLGYWLFSFTCQEWNVTPNSNTLVISADNRELALSILSKYFPGLIPYANSGRVFCDAYSNDQTPIIARLPENPKVIFAGATNGSGYRLAPGIAKEVASLAMFS